MSQPMKNAQAFTIKNSVCSFKHMQDQNAPTAKQMALTHRGSQRMGRMINGPLKIFTAMAL